MAAKEDKSSKPAQRLTEQQRVFALEYAVDFNGARAARAAGYSEGSAKEQAYKLLQRSDIRAMVDDAVRNAAQSAGVSAVYVLRTIKETIERCRQAEPILDDQGRPTGTYRFDAGAVLRGAELLGKHLKMFTDKVEHSGPNGGPIEVSDAKSRLAERLSRLNLPADPGGDRGPGPDGTGS